MWIILDIKISLKGDLEHCVMLLKNRNQPDFLHEVVVEENSYQNIRGLFISSNSKIYWKQCRILLNAMEYCAQIKLGEE